MFKRLGKYFFNGFVTLLPIIITIWVLYVVFNFLDGIVGGLVKDITGRDIKGLGILSVIILSFIIGWLTTYLIGKEIVYLAEEIMHRLPVVNTIYSSVKKINEVLFLQKGKRIEKRVCIVEYPRKGIYSIGFMTGEGADEIRRLGRKDYLNVFIPNTPAPATGFTIVVPKKEVKLLNMSIEDALKIIVSGGALSVPMKGKRK